MLGQQTGQNTGQNNSHAEDVLRELGIENGEGRGLSLQEKREQTYRDTIAGASDLSMLYHGFTQLSELVKSSGESPSGSIEGFSDASVAMTGFVIDTVNKPGGISEMISRFPHTPYGEIPVRYGLRKKIGELLDTLRSDQETSHGIDIVLH